MARDTGDRHSLVADRKVDATGIQWVEAHDAAKQGSPPHSKELSSLKCQ